MVNKKHGNNNRLEANGHCTHSSLEFIGAKKKIKQKEALFLGAHIDFISKFKTYLKYAKVTHNDSIYSYLRTSFFKFNFH